MKFFLKILLSLFLFLTLNSSFLIRPALAQENPVNLYLFWGDGCPHCAKEKAFLEELKSDYPNLKVNQYEVWNSDKNLELLKETAQKLNTKVSGVPFTIIGDQVFVGFNESVSPKELTDRVKYCSENSCPDSVSSITTPVASPESEKKNIMPEKLTLPLFGEIKTKNLSLPIFTFVVAGIDGFNPCAMWTLIFLISLLLGMKDRRRMWILGTAFIAGSALVYFLFLSAWLNLFLFIGFIVWVRVAIGLTALGAGAYYLREYVKNKDASCKVTGGERRQKFFNSLRAIAQDKRFIFAFFGIIALAFAVNLVELVCSAGLPAIYTQVLALSDLPTWQYYAYLVFYILVFMLDDLIVFVVAMVTLKSVGMEGKYARFSHLIGGILMLAIGLILLLKPELLMFG